MKPSAITLAMVERFGGFTIRTLPTAGISWRAYVRSGGPAKYIGKR